MNKKFLSAILFGALMVTSTGTFVSCKDYDDDIDRLDQEIMVEHLQVQLHRILKIAIRLLTVKNLLSKPLLRLTQLLLKQLQVKYWPAM